jgi:hypothetical protein
MKSCQTDRDRQMIRNRKKQNYIQYLIKKKEEEELKMLAVTSLKDLIK